MKKIIVMTMSVSIFAATPAFAANSNTCGGAPVLPAALQIAPLRAPESERVVLKVAAEGTQNYTCAAGKDGKFDWQFTGPRATLYGPNHEVIGQHFKDKKGPAWEFTGGAKIVAGKLAEAPAPATKGSAVNIPLLLLKKVESTGTGPFSTFSYIQRGDTVGGIPSKAYDLCDASKDGKSLEVEYQANYYFYSESADDRLLSCREAPAKSVATVPVKANSSRLISAQ